MHLPRIIAGAVIAGALMVGGTVAAVVPAGATASRTTSGSAQVSALVTLREDGPQYPQPRLANPNDCLKAPQAELSIYGNGGCDGAAYSFRGTNDNYESLTSGAGCSNEAVSSAPAPIDWNDCISSIVNTTLGGYTFYSNINCTGFYDSLPEGAYWYDLGQYTAYDTTAVWPQDAGAPMNDSISSDNAGAYLKNGCQGQGR